MNSMNIASISAETRKQLYDRMDPDRSIADKVWRLEKLTEFETFIAYALGYIIGHTESGDVLLSASVPHSRARKVKA